MDDATARAETVGPSAPGRTLEQAYERARRQLDDRPLSAEPIDARVVHKQRSENVLIGPAEQLDPDLPLYGARVIVPDRHPFFFDHDLDHVPGVALLEAGRQLGLAISHCFHGVPFGYSFVMASLGLEFHRYAELHSPIHLICDVSDLIYRKRVASRLRSTGVCVQGGEDVMTLQGSWQIMSPQVAEWVRRQSADRELTPT